MKEMKSPVRNLQAIAETSRFEAAGRQKEFDALLRAAKAARSSVRSVTSHADKLWQIANSEMTAHLHRSALEASRLADEATQDKISQAISAAAESIEHSRQGLKAAFTQILSASPVVRADARVRPDEWLKALVSDQIPWSATIQNVLKSAFKLDLDAIVWERLAESGRRDLGLEIYQAVGLEVSLSVSYAEHALLMAISAQEILSQQQQQRARAA